MNLKDEIVAGESYSLEFKRVPNEEREKYLKTVVAFANGKGGRILFGVANDRTVVGIPNERIFAEMDGIVNSISDACAPKINMGCYFKGAFRHDRYELPPDGLRELVINAFAHRNYFDHDAPVFVAVYDTRVEITSPGGLPRGQTAEKAISGCSKIRNKAIAEALSYMRYVEGWGSGFLRLNEELSAYGARPVEIEDAGFATRLNVYRVVANTPADKQEDNEGNREGNEGNREGNEGNAAERVLSVLKRNPKASIIALSKELGISHATIERTEKALQTVGRIRRKGGTRGVWEVL